MDTNLSPIGLGGWAFGRTGWGAQEDRDSIAAIRRAVDRGVTWIDTAAVYGDGHSELVVGRALRELPEDARPHVFTKCGVRIDPKTGSTFRDLSVASLRRECEASLHRLGVERIDMYQLHWPVAEASVVEDAWGLLGELQAENKVRWTGVSNFSVDLLERCRQIRPLDAVQLPFSLLRREAAGDVLPWAREHRVLALAYSPLESGLLSGSFSRERLASLEPGDRRDEREQFREPHLARTLALVDRLAPLAARLAVSPAELAIAWTLAWPGIAGAIAGARSAGQVDGWIGAASIALDTRTLDAIAAALDDARTGEGPLLPSSH